jgi:hypothetical protein
VDGADVVNGYRLDWQAAQKTGCALITPKSAQGWQMRCTKDDRMTALPLIAGRNNALRRGWGPSGLVSEAFDQAADRAVVQMGHIAQHDQYGGNIGQPR